MENKVRYQPVYQYTSGKRDRRGNLSAFNVNGAISEDREEAIRLGNRHSAVKSGEAVLIRVDKISMD